MEGYKQDHKGRLVPESQIKAIDNLRDQTVAEALGQAKKLAQNIAEFKKYVLQDLQAFCTTSAERWGVAYGGKKGNITLVSFSGLQKVSYSIAEQISFTEDLQTAKLLIDECICEWAEGSSDEIKTLINKAFSVDKAGNISVQAVLGLRKLNFEHATWKKAMEAIAESIQVISSKSYIRFYERASVDDNWKAINLDIAKV